MGCRFVPVPKAREDFLPEILPAFWYPGAALTGIKKPFMPLLA
jgi:hypothetical protein